MSDSENAAFLSVRQGSKLCESRTDKSRLRIQECDEMKIETPR